MSSNLGFALVGCGRISRKHASLLAEKHINGGELVAVCDTNFEKARFYADKYGVSAYADMHEMMAEQNNKIDVVLVLTESGFHARNVIELAPYGKSIVVEKPMALRLKDADEMIKVCDAYGVRLFVVKQNRFNKPVQALKKAIDEGRFGRITCGTVRVRWMRDQAYYNQDAWRGTWELDGGVFANQASHHIDLLEWLLGDPISVFAKGKTVLVDIATENLGVALIDFRSGALGVVEATTATRPRDLEGSVSVMGEFGTVEIGGFAVNQMKVWEFVKPKPEDKDILEFCNENPPNVYGFGHKAYLEHVVDAIKNKRVALVDGLEGRKSLELISAIYESIETQKQVDIRFQPQRCRLGRIDD